MIIKNCLMCGKETIDRTDNKRKKYCSKECRSKDFYLKNKEKIITQTKQYKLNNIEHISKRCKKYYLKNKVKIKKYNKEYKLKNLVKVKEYFKLHYLKNKEQKMKYYLDNKEYLRQKAKEWYLRNREKIIKKQVEYDKNKYRTDLNFRIKANLKPRIQKALKGLDKSARTMELVGCSPKELWKYLEKKFTQGMTRENYGKWHIDHIKPCASFDLTCHQQQLKCFNYKNLQPLWASENMSKGSKFE
jgi:endogenous inhibitor of DNA gyrase (YacG/DUF329 family)